MLTAKRCVDDVNNESNSSHVEVTNRRKEILLWYR